tara:strand:- start:47372 stop:48034 length:663 start_codon:yes stop_codon:yes gene_type:complete
MSKSAKQGVSDEEFTLDLGNIERAQARNKHKPVVSTDNDQEVEFVIKRKPTVQPKPTQTKKKAVKKSIESPKSNNSKLFNWEVHTELKNKFNVLALDFLRGMGDFRYHKKDFFRLCVEYYISVLKNENTFRVASDDFTRYIQRRGKRPVSERYPRGEERQKLVIELDTDTYQNYLDIIYSHAVKNDDVMNENLSTKYYLYDMVDMIEKDMETILSHFKTL